MKTIKIEKLNINGEGLSFCDNEKWCIKNVLQGEIVEVEKVFQKKDFISARLLRVVEPSHLRIKEKCPFANICGGCDFMFVNKQDSMKIKEQIFKEYFSTLYNGNFVINNSTKAFNYRNKVSFMVNGEKIGLQQRGSNNLVEIPNCLIAKDEINEILKISRFYLKEIHNKVINHIVVRSVDKEVSVTLVCSQKPKQLNKLIDFLKEKFENHFSLFLNFNTNKKEILGNKWEHVFGSKFIISTFHDYKFALQPYSFFQVNDEIRNVLYDKVLNEIKNDIIIEGYSGAGILSCVMSKTAKQVFSIEINKQATEDADKTKEQNNIENLENINGDCKDILPVLAKKYPNATFVIDPPRSGCNQKVLDAILENKINKVIYISCNPYTLKQNLVYLSKGYTIENFEIFNMFPQTFDTESFVILKKK